MALRSPIVLFALLLARGAGPEARAAELLTRLTREQKFWQLFMIPGDLDSAAFDYSKGIFGLQISAAPGVPLRAAARAHAARVDSIQRWFIARTGIPIIVFDEALHGLTREGATVFPQAIALAATWDSSLVRQFVRAFEMQGIIATPKHFVANVGEGGRDSYPIDVSRRALEERYFPPFRSLIVDAGARSVMTAYNSVDGSPATQSAMLMNGVLKREWGLGGFIISDAAATGGATVLFAAS